MAKNNGMRRSSRGLSQTFRDYNIIYISNRSLIEYSQTTQNRSVLSYARYVVPTINSSKAAIVAMSQHSKEIYSSSRGIYITTVRSE